MKESGKGAFLGVIIHLFLIWLNIGKIIKIMLSLKKFATGKSGMSPLLSSVLTVAVIIVSTLLVLNQLVPSIRNMANTGAIEEGKQAISSFDEAVQELLYESLGAKRVVRFQTSSGKFRVSTKDDSVKFYIPSSVQDIDPGSIRKEGNTIVNYGPSSRAYESDIDNDGTTDLVIENDALIFSVRKCGNSTDWASINLSNSSGTFITSMKNRMLGINMTPIFGIYINGMESSSYGNGFTELAESGNETGTAVIRLYMNASSGHSYETFFRLMPGTDFIQAEVRLR